MRAARTGLALLVPISLACARVPPPPPAPAPQPPALASRQAEPPPDRVGPIRADALALIAAQGDALWRAWTGTATEKVAAGRGGDASRAPEGSSRERLLAPESLQAVREAESRAEGGELRALRLLEAFLVGEHLARQTAGTAGRLAAARAQATVEWEGREIGLRRANALLAQEADAGRRAAIEKARWKAESALLPLAEDHRRALDAAARTLGASGALDLVPALRGAEVAVLSDRAEDLLAATEVPYRALMAELARRELALPLEKLRSRDLPRLQLLAQEPRAFPGAAAAERALGTLRALGIDLAARPGVLLDGAARPGKDPRPLLLPVEVPGSIRVSWVPAGGVAEARGLLRTLGGAAFHAEARNPLPELRLLDGVTADAWGGLFEELAGHPDWLAEWTGLSPHNLEPVVAAAAARRLHQAREAAARLLLELARTGDPAADRERARTLAARAFAHPVDLEEAGLFAAEPDPLLRSADALSSAVLSAQAEAWLVRGGGSAWWRSAQAGETLRGALADGSRLAPEERARTLGFERLEATALADVSRARGERAGVRFPAPAGRAPAGPAR